MIELPIGCSEARWFVNPVEQKHWVIATNGDIITTLWGEEGFTQGKRVKEDFDTAYWTAKIGEKLGKSYLEFAEYKGAAWVKVRNVFSNDEDERLITSLSPSAYQTRDMYRVVDMTGPKLFRLELDQDAKLDHYEWTQAESYSVGDPLWQTKFASMEEAEKILDEMTAKRTAAGYRLTNALKRPLRNTIGHALHEWINNPSQEVWF